MIYNLFKRTSLIRTLLEDSHKTIRCRPMIVGRNLNSDSAAYDGDGKTTVKVLGQDDRTLHLIATYSSKGFRLANNLFIFGSILLFPTQVFSWNVKRGIDITSESLMLFDLLVPKVKIVVIGYGQHGEPYDPKIVSELRRKGISCELLPTQHAVTTYNYLLHDSVHVAGAFIPLIENVHMTRRDATELYEYDEKFTPQEERGPINREDQQYKLDLVADSKARNKGQTSFDD